MSKQVDMENKTRGIPEEGLATPSGKVNSAETAEAYSGYSYYSNLLKRVYPSVKELVEAEQKYLKEVNAKNELAQQKAQRAKEVEEAFKKANEDQVTANKSTQEAYKKLNAFIKDFGSYHYSFKEEKEVENNPTTFFETFFNNLWFL